MVRVSKTMANSYSWQKNRKTRAVTARETADENRGKINNVIGKFNGFDEEALKKPEGERPNGINKSSNKGLSKNALWSAEMVKHAQQYVEKGIPIDEFTDAPPAQYGGETMMQVRQNVEEFIIESIVEQELEGIEEELTEAEALTIEEIEELDEIVMEYHEESGDFSGGMNIESMEYYKIILESKNWNGFCDASLRSSLIVRDRDLRFRGYKGYIPGVTSRIGGELHKIAIVFPSEIIGAIDTAIKKGKDYQRNSDGFMTYYSLTVIEELAHFANWDYNHEKHEEMDRILRHGDVT